MPDYEFAPLTRELYCRVQDKLEREWGDFPQIIERRAVSTCEVGDRHEVVVYEYAWVAVYVRLPKVLDALEEAGYVKVLNDEIDDDAVQAGV